MSREAKTNRSGGGVAAKTNLGSEYTEDEVEFLMAMERYKREKKRPFPSCSEVLEVLKSLGYRKVGPN